MGLLFWTILRSITNDPNSKGTFGEMIVTSMFTSKFFGNEERYLINNLFFEDETGTHQIDHVLIYHKGIFAIETKHLEGLVVGTLGEKKWYTQLGANKYELYSPVAQNETHVRVLKKFFENKYKVFSVVVFTKENKPRGIGDPCVNFSELKNYIINYPIDEELTSEQMQEIYTQLNEYKRNCTITREEHIDVLHDGKHDK